MIQVKYLTIFAIIFWGESSALKAVNGQLQLSTYFDSNVRESLQTPDNTYGLKLRGRLNQGIVRSRWDLYGDILTQTYLDALYREESKLIVNSELTFRYNRSPRVHVLGALNHFQKSFYQRSRSYLWTEYSTFIEISPATRFATWWGYYRRFTKLTTTDQIRFNDKNWEFRGRYKLNKRVYLEVTLIQNAIIHKDYPAVNDSLESLEYSQKDKGTKGFIHLRYQGKIIGGTQVGIESVTSNSAIGAFDQRSARLYLSGNWGRSTFYHMVYQQVNKIYKNPLLSGISGYRDPEEPIQNRVYLRLEQLLKGGGTGYLQISLLQNETIYNQRYYDKTMIEMGIQYEL